MTAPMSDAEKVVAELRAAADQFGNTGLHPYVLFARAADLIEKMARERDEALDLASRSTRRLAESSEPGFIGAFARRDAAIAERDQFRDRLTAAEAENARLRAALRPFATVPRNGAHSGAKYSRSPVFAVDGHELTVGHFRDARAALSPKKEQTDV